MDEQKDLRNNSSGWGNLSNINMIEFIITVIFMLSSFLPWWSFYAYGSSVELGGYLHEIVLGGRKGGEFVVGLFLAFCLVNVIVKLRNSKTKYYSFIVAIYMSIMLVVLANFYDDYFTFGICYFICSFTSLLLWIALFYDILKKYAINKPRQLAKKKLLYALIALIAFVAIVPTGLNQGALIILATTISFVVFFVQGIAILLFNRENGFAVEPQTINIAREQTVYHSPEQTNADTIIDNKDAKVDRNETVVELKSKSLSWLKEHQKLVSYLGGAFVAIIIAAVVLPKIFSTSVEKELGIVNYNWDKFVKITNHDTLHGWFHKKPSDNSALLQKCWAVSDEPDAEIGFIWTGEKWTEEMEKTGYDVSNYQFYDGDIFPLLGEEGDFFKVQLNNGPQQSGIEIAYINKECGKIIKSRPIDSELLRNYPRINVIPKGKYKNLALMGQPGDISEVGVLVNGHIIVPEQNVITDQSVITDESDLEDEAKVATIVNMIKKDNPQYEMVAYSLEGNDNNMWTDYFKIK